jgi:hypothetical protein
MKKTLILFFAICFLAAGFDFENKSRQSYQSKSKKSKKKKPSPKQKQKKPASPVFPKRPPELTGSKEQRIAQNLRAIQLGLPQIQTEDELKKLAQDKVLVELGDTRHYYVDRGLIKKSRALKNKKVQVEKERRPVFVYLWAKSYLEKLAEDFFRESHKRFKIVSGARSLWLQHEMTRKGSAYYTPYAAKAGDPLEESLHARANTIDISRRGMTLKEIKWMRDRLIADKNNGVEVELENQEETEGAEEEKTKINSAVETEPIEERICYHIVVFPKEQLPAPSK